VHVCLRGLLGSVVWTFYLADTKTYGDFVPSLTSAPLLPKLGQLCHGTRRRMVCLPLVVPSRIRVANAVPKVGIVCPTAPSPPMLSTGMLITGNASYQNVTWNYINCQWQRPLPPPAIRLMSRCSTFPLNVAAFASRSSWTSTKRVSSRCVASASLLLMSMRLHLLFDCCIVVHTSPLVAPPLSLIAHHLVSPQCPAACS
jgi:hypothetical protein